MNSETEVWKPHVTVAAVCEKDKRFLLVSERVNGRIVLNQPAGHVEPGESVQQAVVRETLEETGYEFAPAKLVGIYRYTADQARQQTYLRFTFSGELGKRQDRKLDDDIISTEWMSIDEIRQSHHMLRSPMVMQSVLDYLQKPSYPLQVFSTEFL